MKILMQAMKEDARTREGYREQARVIGESMVGESQQSLPPSLPAAMDPWCHADSFAPAQWCSLGAGTLPLL